MHEAERGDPRLLLLKVGRGMWDVYLKQPGKKLETVAHSSANPEFEAAYALWLRGWVGKITTYHKGTPSLVIDIIKAAKTYNKEIANV